MDSSNSVNLNKLRGMGGSICANIANKNKKPAREQASPYKPYHYENLYEIKCWLNFSKIIHSIFSIY